MRIVTFNVNSLQRLLNHPIQHIFKKTKSELGSAAVAVPHNDNEEKVSEIEISQVEDEADEEMEDEFNDDERFDWMKEETFASYQITTTSPSSNSRLSSTPPATTVTSTPTSSRAHQQPLSQADLDSLEQTQQLEYRERLAHVTAASTKAPFNHALSTRLAALLDGLHADIICFQEMKMSRQRLPEEMAIVDGWYAFFSFSKRRQGYSGVATYVKRGTACPVRAEEGFTGMLSTTSTAASIAATSTTATPASSSTSIGEYATLYSEMEPQLLKELDSEGRCVMTDHERFVLFNCYFPNAPNEQRQEFKSTFYRGIQLRAEALVRSGRNVIIVGDVNACHQRIDHADFAAVMKTAKTNPKPVIKNATFNFNSSTSTTGTKGKEKEDEPEFEEHPSRHWLNTFLVDGGGMFVDVFRRFHPNRMNAYTCWNTKVGARLSNYGSRIDYVLANKELYDSGFFQHCDIRPDIHCSDHCPVEADLNVTSLCSDPNRIPPPLCSRFFPEFSGAQQSIQSFFTKTSTTSLPLIPSTAASSPPSSPSSSKTNLKRPFSFPLTSTTTTTTTYVSANSSTSSVMQPPNKKARVGSSAMKKSLSSSAYNNMSLHSFFGQSTTKGKAAESTKPTSHTHATTTTPTTVSAFITPSLDSSTLVASPSHASVASSPAAASPATITSASSPVITSTSAESVITASSTNSPSHPQPPPTVPTSAPTPSPSSLVDSTLAWKQLLNQKSNELRCPKHKSVGSHTR